MNISEAGKEELALALLLWKDFKMEGKLDPKIVKQSMEFADHLGVRKQFDAMHSQLPPMKIEPRYK